MAVFVKQYGIQRSGTNYVQLLLERNFRARVFHFQLGSKHLPHPKAIDWKNRRTWKGHDVSNSAKKAIDKAVKNKTMRYIVVVKDPHAWIVSMIRWKKRTVDVAHLLKQWNRYYKNWHNLVTSYELAALVRYEDLLTNFTGSLNAIGGQLRLNRKSEKYQNVNKKLVASPRETSQGFDKTYYTQKKFLDDMSKTCLKLCRQHLSQELMEAFGYTPY